MAVVRVNPNLQAEVTGSLASGGPMSRVLGEVAEEIALEAQWIARREFYRTGNYMHSIESEVGMDEAGELVGRVYATDFKAHWAEFGTSHMRARHILKRAAERVGFRVLVEHGLVEFGGPLARGAARLAIRGARRRQLAGARRRAITGTTGRREITGR